MQPKSSIVAQLADFMAWSKTGSSKRPISFLDYVGFAGTPDLFFGFAELFWPELIVHDGLHFLASRFSEEGYSQWQGTGASRRDIQRVMNHIHVSTLIQGEDISDEMAVEIASALAKMWQRTLGPQGIIAEAFGSDFGEAAATFYDAS